MIRFAFRTDIVADVTKVSRRIASRAVEQDFGEWLADRQEVWAQTTNRVLSDASYRKSNHRSEQKDSVDFEQRDK